MSGVDICVNQMHFMVATSLLVKMEQQMHDPKIHWSYLRSDHPEGSCLIED